VINGIIINDSEESHLGFQKIKRGDPSLRSGWQRKNDVILQPSKESHFFLFLKKEILWTKVLRMTVKS